MKRIAFVLGLLALVFLTGTTHPQTCEPVPIPIPPDLYYVPDEKQALFEWALGLVLALDEANKRLAACR